VLDPLIDEGWTVHTTHYGRLRPSALKRQSMRPYGDWELAICTRLPAADWTELLLPVVFRDHARARQALACTLRVGDVDVDLVGFHASSKLWYAGPILHMRGLARHLPRSERPAIIAGDFNFWGPGVSTMLPGWRRAVVGRTYPSHRPHSQIDHILVNEKIEVLSGEVLPACGSDHRPVCARLRLLEG
jgi:endonuclease/exonuclease/phosphatase (EEP) superfamily protein YafD